MKDAVISEDCAQARMTRAISLALMALLLAFALSGCARRGGPIPYDPASFGAADVGTRGAAEEQYPLGPMDDLEITVFRVPELSGSYSVGIDGMLDMPLIGTVDVRDRTPREVAVLLEQRYGRTYLQSPDVTVKVSKSNQLVYTVDGGAASPGIYPVVGRLTLIQAIAAAKGVDKEYGNPRQIAIFRKIDGQMQAAAFDLTSIRKGEMRDPLIYPGDKIIVDSDELSPLIRQVLATVAGRALFEVVR